MHSSLALDLHTKEWTGCCSARVKTSIVVFQLGNLLWLAQKKEKKINRP